ncbi:MAG: MBL fold metallo-hydrolase [Spirochaetales bacterium]|nr:MBL fold metallo-hydrolase [Spirochaetales bacterium]
MRVTILGSGTSHGVPVIGCDCDTCLSEDPRDKRTRSSITIEENGAFILIDTSTDFRTQAIREGIKKLDAILMTHSHADHLHGIDDTRPLTWDNPLPVYGSAEVLEEIRTRFDYIFKETQRGGGKPKLDLRLLPAEEVAVAGIRIQPIPVMHGDVEIYGFRIGSFAYITDCSAIPEKSYKLLSGVTHLVIGALRYRPHATHFSIDEAITAAGRIGAAHAWLTHLCHDVNHQILTRKLSGRENPSFLPAFDGLLLEI